jgi:lipopolysaccharide/colanic/teichoic acid biosynthesis glycosyltransferase
LKAILAAELMTCMALFSLMRLDGIPRSAPAIHALVLATGLFVARTFARVLADDHHEKVKENSYCEHNVIIGLNRLSALYIKLLRACAPNKQRVVAVLDDRPYMVGRTIEGVRVVGPPDHLDAIINEYAVHGIGIDRAVVAGEADMLSVATMHEIKRVCERRRIPMCFVPEIMKLHHYGTEPEITSTGTMKSELTVVPRYFQVKYILDFFATAIALTVLIPLFAAVSLMVFFDVGVPLLFWQQRIGMHGRSFLLYKFRTLRPPYDCRGKQIPSDKRMSWIGHLLRETSLDELPQLLNVLVGDMSLIGPRPLLPEDQPADPSKRLAVRPGITGWAQVNGRKRLSADDKAQLDEWYVQNCSFWLDLQIVFKTSQIVLTDAVRSGTLLSKGDSTKPRSQLQSVEQTRPE